MYNNSGFFHHQIIVIILPSTKNKYKDLVQYCFPACQKPRNLELSSEDVCGSSKNEEQRLKNADLILQTLTEGGSFTLRRFADSTCTQLLTISSRRGWIALRKDISEINIHEHTLIFFPHREHLAAYMAAGKFSNFGGPSSYFPGSVGVLHYQADSASGILRLQELQSSVNHCLPDIENILNDNSGQTRSLKNYYSHWKFDLLKIAANFAIRLGINQIAIKDVTSLDQKLFHSGISLELLRDALPNLGKLKCKANQHFDFGNSIEWLIFNLK